MKILIDMNLSPSWVEVLKSNGIEAVHWSAVGAANAKDAFIMQWAIQNGFIVFTHDLDFGTLLALTKAVGPSVLQIRSQDILPDRVGAKVISVLRKNQENLDAGALIVIDETRARVRILPF